MGVGAAVDVTVGAADVLCPHPGAFGEVKHHMRCGLFVVVVHVSTRPGAAVEGDIQDQIVV